MNEIEQEYKPARIFESLISNPAHISIPQFSDDELGKPYPPIAPTLACVKRWQPIGWTVVLIIISFGLPIFLLALAGLWVWALLVKYPQYQEDKEKSDLVYKKALAEYENNFRYYKTEMLPKWQKEERAHILKFKQEEWRKSSIDQICYMKGWRVHSSMDIAKTQAEGYIGPGELELFQALSHSHLLVRHQVDIERYYYTADMVCFNPDSGKLCVVEVDGSQHWLDPKQINRDYDRMESLASQGVSTIRFKNMKARSEPRICAKHIENFLS